MRIFSEEGGFGGEWQRLWYVVATVPCGEDLALAKIRELGFEVFAPEILKRVTHARKVMDVKRKLFRNYVFVADVLAARHWPEINRCRGVSRILTLADSGRMGAPASIRPGFVEGLMACGPVLVDPAIDKGFQAGELVRIVGGVFAGQVRRIVELDSRGRAVFLQRMLGKDHKVVVPQAGLVAATSAH